MAKIQPPKPLSIIFVNYNSSELLSRALDTLEQEEGAGLDIELIVVDNGSNDRRHLRDLCLRRGVRLVLLKRNLGYGAAANRGFHYARGRYVAVANPDITFLPRALSQLVHFLETNPEAGVVSPQLLYPDRKPQPSCRRLPKLRYVFAGRRSPLVQLFPNYAPAREFLYAELWEAKSPVEVEAVIGTLMVFRRAAFESVKGFDEAFFMFAEDLDICQRLREQGWKVFLEPRARVVHEYGGVRRHWRRFSEFQRVKGLCRFFTRRKKRLARLLLTIGFAGYYFLLEAAGLCGLGELEYSWSKSGCPRR
jgi:GT2 family glycosyltransferase